MIYLTYQDLVSQTKKGIFGYMEDIKPLPIKNYTGKMLDDYFYLSNSQKQLPQTVITLLLKNSPDDVLKRYAQILYTFYYDKWEKQNELINDETAGSKRIVTENVGKKGTTTDNTTNTKKVSAYDSDDFVNDEQNENKQDNATTDDTERTLTETQTYGTQLDSTISRLQNYVIYDIMFTDVKTMLCLSIY